MSSDIFVLSRTDEWEELSQKEKPQALKELRLYALRMTLFLVLSEGALVTISFLTVSFLMGFVSLLYFFGFCCCALIVYYRRFTNAQIQASYQKTTEDMVGNAKRKLSHSELSDPKLYCFVISGGAAFITGAIFLIAGFGALIAVTVCGLPTYGTEFLLIPGIPLIATGTLLIHRYGDDVVTISSRRWLMSRHPERVSELGIGIN